MRARRFGPAKPISVRRILEYVLTAGFLGFCLAPHAQRLAHPSIYADDAARIEQLQVMRPWEMLWRPFNEHLAPAFEGISLATWFLADRTLSRAPLAFTAASLLPLPLVLGLLFIVVRRESGSATAGLLAVAVFSLSTLPLEVFWWYSASSFAWALAATLVAWLGVISGGVAGGILAAGGAFLAPAFSAIGLLAGPACAVRAMGGRREGSRASRSLRLAPVLGTMAYLALYAGVVGFRSAAPVPGDDPRHLGDLTRALLDVARAPSSMLLPGLIGHQDDAATGLPGWLGLALSGSLLIALASWLHRRPGGRHVVLASLILILGGYALTFVPRAGLDSTGWSTLRVQRYHLFPQLGAVLILAVLTRPLLARLDARWLSSLAAATGFALLLTLLHGSIARERLRYLSFPDQERTLAALDRLSAICRRHGITREQALRALDPIHPNWMPIEWYNPLGMLRPAARTPELPEADVRPTLLAALDARDREGLCVGLEITPHLRPTEETAGNAAPIYRFHVDEGRGSQPQWEALRVPAFLDYVLEVREVPPGTKGRLVLPGSEADRRLELWWAGGAEDWSELRSLRWRIPETGQDAIAWTVPLERIPHFDPERVDRIRVLARSPGPMGWGAPLVLRANADPPRLVTGSVSTSRAN